jgi:lysophospholipase L1-like esterase
MPCGARSRRGRKGAEVGGAGSRCAPLRSALALALGLALSAAEEPWVAAMRAVHAHSAALPGSVSQIGDSITYSKAFLAGVAWGEATGPQWEALKRLTLKDFNERKGQEHANFSGWTAADGLARVPAVLAAERPAMAVIMFGTNDVRKQVAVADYAVNLRAIVDLCLRAGCIPIVSTIPPQLGQEAQVQAFNEVVRRLAVEARIPLVDFHAAILARRPGTTWDGTLLGKGDVHPSGGAGFDFSEANLTACGYALRNYLTCQALKQVIERCY